MTGRVLTLDIESHSRENLYIMPPEEFVRLIGYAWDEDPVVITTDLEDLREQIRKARWIVGHNIHDFDLRAIFGIDSNEPMALADQGRVYDTWTHAALVNPCPPKYLDRHGKWQSEPKTNKVEWAKKWYSLDEQAFQLGVQGKTNDFKELALKWGPKEGLKAARVAAGAGMIPLDDPEYREYLEGDVRASQAVGKALLARGPLDAYALREQRIEARKACISSNGWRVDVQVAQARVDFLEDQKNEILDTLVSQFDFPTEGKKPWSSNAGKDAIKKALASYGINEGSKPNWPRTGTGQWSLGGQVLLENTKGTDAEALGRSLAILMGQRSLAKLALDSMYPDGKVHPEISMLQKSGRWSTTEPGLTVWTSRGEGAVEKAYYLPDFDDHVLLEFDLSNADARAVAANSGDKEFAKRFEPGADGHLINAWAAWGKEVVGTDKHDPTTAMYRQKAKAPGHGWGYKMGGMKMHLTTNLPLDECKTFIKNMNKAFPDVVAWQKRCTDFALEHGYIMNPWGRRMKVDSGREWTQPPALVGQSSTREMVCDMLLELKHEEVRMMKVQVHDAVVFSVPKANWEYWRDYILSKLEGFMNPPGGQYIAFPAGCGPAGANWMEASHG